MNSIIIGLILIAIYCHNISCDEINNSTEISTDSTTNITAFINNNTESESDLILKSQLKPNRIRAVHIELHQTNMYENEVEKCKHIVNSTLSHEYGSRKTARLLKSELDDIFKDQKYRFSVIISSNVTNIHCKRLYGIWVSMTANGKHYLLIASYKAVKTKKLSEAQMDRIEDWTAVYFITYENMTKEERFVKVAKMLKEKLDLNYGKRNLWGVIVYKHSTNIRAKRLFDSTPQIQFKRLDHSYWFAFRGGEDIPITNRLNQTNDEMI